MVNDHFFKVRFIGLPGFKSMDVYPLEQLFFEDKTAIELYNSFKSRLFKAIEDGVFLPVMRMCDGEYIYCVGKKKNVDHTGYKLLKFYLGRLLKREKTSWGESYTKKQNKQLKKEFPFLLKRIAGQGMIANHFMYSHTHFCEEYIEPMKVWYNQHDIRLNSKNFTAFYFVYVLLNGPDSFELFNQKNILILSSFDQDKRTSVEKELKARGAGNVYFEAISKNRSMLDKLNLDKYKDAVNLVLIAGGIGSANILLQCENLNAVCIDAGFCLDCIADPAKRNERVYCLPD